MEPTENKFGAKQNPKIPMNHELFHIFDILNTDLLEGSLYSKLKSSRIVGKSDA